MIDIKLLRENPTSTQSAIGRKDPDFPVHTLIQLDEQVRELSQRVEQIRHERNTLAKSAGPGGPSAEVREKGQALALELKQLEPMLQETQHAYTDLLLRVPNIPHDDVPSGNKESNKEVAQGGTKPSFDFPVQHHVTLMTRLGWLDLEAAARMTGSQFALYKGDGVRLMYALAWYLLKNAQKHGYELVLPPYLVNQESLINASNFPRFADQVYHVAEENLYLTPTAEVNITNLYRDTTLSDTQLPVRHAAWTSCFRREAGGYGAHERGLIRIHQFEKVELYTVCAPDQAVQEQQRMITAATKVLDDLGLHYRVMLLAAQDCSFASAKTFDIEVWLPGQQEYKEVSSISDCGDFQARRTHIKYKTEGGKKAEYVSTLNGSCLAFARLVVAIVETYQQADGSIRIPDCLLPYWL